MNELFVLDACSVIALLREEQGHKNVEAILNNASLGGNKIFIHKVTLAEVVYDLLRSDKYVSASAILAACYQLPVVVVDDLTDAFIALVAEYKVHFRVSFADCFVLALAKLHNAGVITADHHEFDVIERAGGLRFEWIR